MCFKLEHFFVCGVLFFYCGMLHAEPGAFDAVSEEVNKVFQATAPSVVKVRSVNAVEPLAGTGFFIDAKGTILTSSAIIGEDYKVVVEYQGKKVDALVLSRDPRSGVALLRIEAESTPFLGLGNSDELKVASQIVSVAHPYNLPASPSLGMVTGFDVQYLDRFFATTHIRANLNVSPGQIGGPLLNAQGKVVGMLIMAIDDGKFCYALPSNAAGKVIKDMSEYGMARHGWVGVGVVQDTSGKGNIVKVSTLFDGTPAKNSGIESGDRVLKIGNREIHQPSDILDAAFFSKIGEKLPVLVERNGKTKVYHIEVRERPAQSKPVQPIPATPVDIPSKRDEPIRIKAGNVP
ncbi:MAG: S1C family serine protease [Verrucomicrobiota bacterium]